MYGSNVSSAVVSIHKTNTLNASIFLCLLVTSHSQIHVSIIISRFWGAQGRFNSSSLGITVLHPLCPVFLKWHLLFSSRAGKTLRCYNIQSLCATLRKGHLHSPLPCTSGWRDLHYLRLISAHFRWILYKVIQILQEWVKNEEKIHDHDEHWRGCTFLLFSMESASACRRVHTDGRECSFLQNQFAWIFHIAQLLFTCVYAHYWESAPNYSDIQEWITREANIQEIKNIHCPV